MIWVISNVDEFAAMLMDSSYQAEQYIRTLQRSSIEDFASGYIQGIVKILEIVSNHCNGECREIGMVAATFSSGMFCAVSERLGRTATFVGIEDIPNLICGTAYRLSCEGNFYSKTRNMCSDYATGYAFKKYYKARYNGCCSYKDD